MAVFIAFGDSITHGLADDQAGGWVARFGKWLTVQPVPHAGEGWFVYELGTCGETTAGAKQCLACEIAQRRRTNERTFISLAWGANDATFIPSEQQFRVEVEQYARNLAELITTARAESDELFVLNTNAVVDEIASAPPGKDRSRLNRYVTRYNDTLACVCREQGIPLVDVFAAFQRRDLRALLSADGFHPSAAGHAVICEVFMEQWKQRFKV